MKLTSDQIAGDAHRPLARGADLFPHATTHFVGGPLGEKVAVFVQLREGHSIDLFEISQHFIASGGARQKTPEHLQFVSEFPRGLSGKVRKIDLRDRLAR